MIITVSGRRVKRSHQDFVSARGKGRGIWTRQAKALAPWAGIRYSLVLPPSVEVPPEPVEALHLTADIECLLQWWDAFPTAAQQDAYDRERANACRGNGCEECGPSVQSHRSGVDGEGWMYAPVGHASEQMGCPECGGGERYVD